MALIVPFRFEKFIGWSCLLHINAVIYNMLIIFVRLPVALVLYVLNFRGRSLTKKSKMDALRFLIIVVSTCILIPSTQPS